MARLRKFKAYRNWKRPYTRISKFRKKAYIRANPNVKVVRFDMGNLTATFPTKIQLKFSRWGMVRHNALESARLVANRYLEKHVGKAEFHLKVLVYPHHVLRENALASGAGADRMSTGMAHSFGKAVSNAAQLKKDQAVMEVNIPEEHLEMAKEAMHRSNSKLPCKCNMVITRKA